MNKWLDDRLEELGKTKVALAEVLGGHHARVHDIIKGKRRIQAVEVPAMAAFLEWPEQTLLDKINGRRINPARVAVAGYIGAGAEIRPIDDYPKGEGLRRVPCPAGLNPATTVAAIVKGASQEPMVFDNWIVFFSRDPEQDIYGVVGRLCVVKTADGKMLLKQVRRGPTPGKFNLISINAELLEDVELEWASPVRHMQEPG